MSDQLALHERLELHEIITFKNLCLTKSATMHGLVGCDQLKSILERDVSEGKVHVEQLNQLLKQKRRN
ncbi:hypothetical protein ERJ70_06590 [Sediminibacillus dalangtanensis]|uniref:Spore coat protein n=1 Tax=Sediminibacillus dalangtanensis TaxID=2729421 RepID=A0ABX7VQ51_9BACI|nr:hypothetical protein [Sediminibacillus dalangtanensis]QTM98999.1 hypothetical protein ERJ70_06590 [Sediminibacillus dalangtanensis]